MVKAILLALLVVVGLTGCVVSPAYPEEPGYYEPGPDFWIFGGLWGDHGRNWDREAGHRGAESRGAAGHFGRPAGGSGGHFGGGRR